MTRPKRIQRKRTKGWKMPANTVYVGRPTKWGNPWTPKNVQMLGSDGHGGVINRGVATAKDCVRAFRETVLDGSIGSSVEDIRRELQGKDLACWCPLDSPCHADVLLELANQ